MRIKSTYMVEQEMKAPGFLMTVLKSTISANDCFCMDGLSTEEK